MFKTFGVWEIILILAIILIFFGVGKLPQVGEAMGKAIRSFKKSQSSEDEEDTKKATAKKEDTNP
ncbi:MAG: twin-arginine translocase TatA/TatE family subunit, partial [Nitrospira sp.]|nr:twin-arginine translocase TatA/TatE family subunit [Nitrospira sp.]